ncbi:hypothetical protein PMO31116_02750 [Pandoraea morbifera]|uniref:Uncharacterized protein n=1 Tax=Pandoraea morbifera TaxID=2508300 RepID=A0A5E4VQR1_9BURK|nr:hypothetical protein PMO31116_02750 [Pandoraea morbifera]
MRRAEIVESSWNRSASPCATRCPAFGGSRHCDPALRCRSANTRVAFTGRRRCPERTCRLPSPRCPKNRCVWFRKRSVRHARALDESLHPVHRDANIERGVRLQHRQHLADRLAVRPQLLRVLDGLRDDHVLHDALLQHPFQRLLERSSVVVVGFTQRLDQHIQGLSVAERRLQAGDIHCRAHEVLPHHLKRREICEARSRGVSSTRAGALRGRCIDERHLGQDLGFRSRHSPLGRNTPSGDGAALLQRFLGESRLACCTELYRGTGKADLDVVVDLGVFRRSARRRTLLHVEAFRGHGGASCGHRKDNLPSSMTLTAIRCALPCPHPNRRLQDKKR